MKDRNKRRLADLDRKIYALSVPWLNTNAEASRFLRHLLDLERCDVRCQIKRAAKAKKYTGSGVGGSARRGTPRSVGSSPTSPTTQGGRDD